VTTVYLVRHATPNFNNHDDFTRELTAQGWKDRALVTAFLRDKQINAIFSSPYKRAVDTIKEFADAQRMEIQTIPAFRERKVGSAWIENFDRFCKAQWENFDFKLPDGESLREVQERNIGALYPLLESYTDKNIVIGGHGTAISTILHYFDSSFGYYEFNQIKNWMPWIVKLSFEGSKFLEMEKYKIGPAAKLLMTES